MAAVSRGLLITYKNHGKERIKMGQQTRHEGTVKWFNSSKGFGFIGNNDGRDIFVHFSDIDTDDEYRTLLEGQKVTYEIGQSPNGDKAVLVRPQSNAE